MYHTRTEKDYTNEDTVDSQNLDEEFKDRVYFEPNFPRYCD